MQLVEAPQRPERAPDRWVLTDTGRAEIQLGMSLSHPHFVMEPRPVPVLEMRLFDLMQRLERQGWACVVVETKQAVARAKSKPYDVNIPDAPKTWFIHPIRDAGGLAPTYLKALLTVDKHRRPVPHFATMTEYKQILDPEFRPRKRKAEAARVESIADNDAWDDPIIDETPAKRRARGPRRAMLALPAEAEKRLAALEDAPAGAGAEGGDPSSSISCSSSSSSSSRKSGATSRKSLASSSSAGSIAGAAGGSTPDAGVGGRLSSPPPTPPLPPPATPSPERAPSPVPSEVPSSVGASVVSVGSRAARAFQGLPFGKHWLTFRYRDGVVVGEQLRCGHDGHKAGSYCTKEISYIVAGGPETARRMLLTWACWGSCVDCRKDHRTLWQYVTDDMKEGMLLPMVELEDLVSKADPEVAEVPAPRLERAPPAPPPASGHRNLLGKRHADAPVDVHKRCEQMYLEGKLPHSTLAQRKLCMQSIGKISIGVPSCLVGARDWGYVHPYLPPPQGMCWWSSKANAWTLRLKGG